MLRIVRSNRGMSILEVMVASGLVMVLFLGISELVRFSAKSAKSVGLSTDYNNMVSAIKQVLDQEQTCAWTFKDYSISPTSTFPIPVEIKTETGGNIAKVGNIVSGLKTTQLQFESIVQDLGTRMDGKKAFIARLHLQVEKAAAPTGETRNVGARFMDSYYNVTLIQNPGGNIHSCYAITSASDICNTMTDKEDNPGSGVWKSLNMRCVIFEPVCKAMGGIPTPSGCDFRYTACLAVGGRVIPTGATLATFERCILPTDGARTVTISCNAVSGILRRYPNPDNPTDPDDFKSMCDVCTPLGGVWRAPPALPMCDFCTPQGMELVGDGTGRCKWSQATCLAWGGTVTGTPPATGCTLPLDPRYSPNSHGHSGYAPDNHGHNYADPNHSHP